jgi:hypothetical protein
MEKKRVFEPGDMVTSFRGEAGVVVSDKEYETVRTRLKEGKRPGHYFSPGCCHHPDYITQIPVLFEDGRYDVMRPMNIKKSPDLPEEKQKRIQDLIIEHTR